MYKKNHIYLGWLGLLALTACSSYPPLYPILSPNQILVQPGESILILSCKHNILPRELIELNEIPPPYTINPGQVLTISTPKKGRDNTPSTSESVFQEPLQTFHESSQGFLVKNLEDESEKFHVKNTAKALPTKNSDLTLTQSTLPPAPKPSLSWPLKGPILQTFSSGTKKNARSDGIRISSLVGSKVKAVKKGKVIYVGREVPGMGNLIVIRHENDWITAYGHVKNKVEIGHTVQQEQIIGTLEKSSGKTHLYFELRRKNAKAIDPLLHLGK